MREQVERSTLHVEGLAKRVTELEESIHGKEMALSGMGREMKNLRATIQDKDKALKSANSTTALLRDEIVGLRTHLTGVFFWFLFRHQGYL